MKYIIVDYYQWSWAYGPKIALNDFIYFLFYYYPSDTLNDAAYGS